MIVWSPVSVAAQDSTTAARQAALDSMSVLLRAQYVSADTGNMIADHVQRRARANAYAGLSDSAFGAAVTQDLRSINNDLHLSLRFAGAITQQSNAPLPLPPRFIGRAEVVDDNVGVLELLSIARPSVENLAALRAVFERLADVSALVIDVRQNPGGAAPMNDTLWSYFVADSQTTAIVSGRTGPTVERFARPRAAAPRFTTIPIFIVTGARSGSAAEGFTFFLQQSGRARVVGARSAGAGHIVNGFLVGNGYVAGISVARVRNPKSGKEWERVGVVPDEPVDEARALDRAIELARAAARARRAKEAEGPRTAHGPSGRIKLPRV